MPSTFEFSLKMRRMRSNLSYLLKPFLLYEKICRFFCHIVSCAKCGKLRKSWRHFLLSLSFRVTRQESRIGEAQLVATKKNGVAFSHLIPWFLLPRTTKDFWLLQTKKKKKSCTWHTDLDGPIVSKKLPLRQNGLQLNRKCNC